MASSKRPSDQSPQNRLYRPAGGVATRRGLDGRACRMACNPCQKRERPQYGAFGLPIRQKIKQGALRLSLALLLELLLAVVFSKLPMRQKKRDARLLAGIVARPASIARPPPAAPGAFLPHKRPLLDLRFAC